MPPDFTPALLDWYAQHGRSLPWRGHPDAYAVWVSEIMLQQTRVDTVIPYFARWMERFPSITALAAASEQEVLQTWEGLGYYSRARNLHKAARLLILEHDGRLPASVKTLQKLPGIGKYTAGAICSLVYRQDEAALDGNIRRVLARLFNVEIPAKSTAGEAELWRLARLHIPPGHAGDYNQALMDLGASICTPRSPQCLLCPVQTFCQAYQLGIQEQRPVLDKRQPVPHYIVTAAVLQRDGSVLIARRPSSGLLGGMWEFPGGKVEAGEELVDGLIREICEELGTSILVGEPFGVYQHAYTHFTVTLHAFRCTLEGAEPRALQASELRWVTPGELDAFPMGKIDRQIARRLQRPDLQHGQPPRP
jgi:A/G-specific adenine glycosylase